jgi:hypothetical protein
LSVSYDIECKFYGYCLSAGNYCRHADLLLFTYVMFVSHMLHVMFVSLGCSLSPPCLVVHHVVLSHHCSELCFSSRCSVSPQCIVVHHVVLSHHCPFLLITLFCLTTVHCCSSRHVSPLPRFPSRFCLTTASCSLPYSALFMFMLFTAQPCIYCGFLSDLILPIALWPMGRLSL